VTNDTRRPVPTASASALHRQAVASTPTLSARTSTSSNANDYFQDSNAAEDDMDAWGDMEEESFFDASSDYAPKTTPAASNPFDDNGEPDFAGWLAAQAGKKPGGKPLPKGLAKPATSTAARPASGTRASTTGSVGTAAKKPATATLKPKPIVAKKIDTTPKAAADDEGWGDGW
jgi:SCY1-like protein 1